MSKDQVEAEVTEMSTEEAIPETEETESDPVAKDSGEVENADQAEGDSEQNAEDQEQEIPTLTPEEQVSLLIEEVRHLKREVATNFDRFQRVSAEYANYQKRMEQEIRKTRDYAIDRFAREMLDFVETLDKASEFERPKDADPAVNAMLEGMELTRKQLMTTFQKFGIEEIDPKPGDTFDVNFHQAMTMRQTEEFPPNHICEVFRKGFTIHDRLLRPAMVIVASKPPEETE